MIDIHSLSSIAEVASGVVSGVIGFWKMFISPGRKFRSHVTAKLKDFDNRLGKLEADVKNFEQLIQDEVGVLEKETQRQLDSIQKDQGQLQTTLKEHIEKVDAKNDKLLDLIIKYFTEKE